MIRPRVRSYGDSSTRTLSPGRMRMKFLRILPEMWARTWCLFSSSTLNIALGSGSTTVAMTSMASSLGIALRPHRRSAGRSQLAGPQDHGSLGLKGDGELEVGRSAAVERPHRPTVTIDRHLGAPEVEHRLDRDDHARLQQAAPSARPVVGDLG